VEVDKIRKIANNNYFLLFNQTKIQYQVLGKGIEIPIDAFLAKKGYHISQRTKLFTRI
jgi:hypothetical protein